MPARKRIDFESLYAQFQAPISALDCGEKCAPHNEYGVPFCCDTSHSVPTAYLEEWDYLKSNTYLWHLWRAKDPAETARLQSEIQENQVLIECLGHDQCQRDFRSITCRAFPFFPYLTKDGDFIGLSFYTEYEERCWVISNLQHVSAEYVTQFVAAFEFIFEAYPGEFENFKYHSKILRQVFGRRKRGVPILHRDGNIYLARPRDGQLRKVDSKRLPKYEPYKTAALMPFPDEEGSVIGEQ